MREVDRFLVNKERHSECRIDLFHRIRHKLVSLLL